MNWSRKQVILISIVLSVVVLSAILVPVLVITLRTDDPIYIASDEDFLNYDFPGSGTAVDPFIIEDLFIKEKPDALGFAIEIKYTTSHFIIQNCEFIGYYWGSIVLNQVAKGTAKILNNNLHDFGLYCIACFGSDEIIIANNTLSNGYYGIFLEECHNSLVEDNTCHSTVNGIRVTYSDSVMIQNNILSLNDYGIYNLASSNIIIQNNEVLGRYSSESAGTGSDMLGPAIWIVSGNRTLITNNTCSFHPSAGIKLRHSHFCNVSFNILRDNRGTEEGMGIFLWKSNYSTIFYNLISSNDAGGTLLMYSYNNTFHHNGFVDNGDGVIYHAMEYYSEFNIWYDTLLLEGNFWSSWDYLIPYPIEGSISTDPYPLSSNPLT
ncbi:MAG: hypothetical protein GPJ51_06200 [Candidatus Heimdallarchaeota archaeon]|nr:hypothetical protein [Candidatus Heimdallarchaeota archaeon]